MTAANVHDSNVLAELCDAHEPVFDVNLYQKDVSTILLVVPIVTPRLLKPTRSLTGDYLVFVAE